MNVLHVYGQHSWHDSAYVVGDKNALMALRDAIDEAIKNGIGKAHVFVADGEEYTLNVVEKNSDSMENMSYPYIAEYAACSKKGRPPYSLVPLKKEHKVLSDKDWFAAQKRINK
jgi:hypothetical protein